MRCFLIRIVDSAARAVPLALGIALAGCHTPAGPQFEPALPAGAEGALAYVYHVSPSRSVRDYGERIFVDGIERGLLQTNFGDVCEYLWLHLAPGPHRFEVETNSRWFNLGSIPKNPVALNLTATAGSVYVVRVETTRNIGMGAGISVSTSGGVQSGSGFYAGPGGKTIGYSQNVDDAELRECRVVEAPAVR